MFLGTGSTTPPPYRVDGGLITDSGISTTQLSELPTGYFGFFDAKTYQTIKLTDYNCCPLILASSSVLQKDKIGPFHGGYRETNKSKVINPKYVQQVYRVDACEPKQAVVSVGYTPQTAAGDLVPNMFQGGTTEATCCFEFLCGETYYLRIDVKGSPALRALNHNAYQTLSAYTGCCLGPTPTPVNSTLVFIEWAKALIINNYLKDFVLPVVFDETGLPWYAPGTTLDPISGIAVRTVIDPVTGDPVPATWNLYDSTIPHVDGACGGLRLLGAFVETKFGNCTFQVTDFFEKEPIKIYASMVDYTGDPCVFEGICVYNDCLGLQGMGFGEQVVRDLIRAESYLQNFFHSGDFRVREITQGYDMTSAIDRTGGTLYTRYYILHSVPRFNNPTGTFDNDRYLLEIITDGQITALDTFLSGPFLDCVGCEEFGEYSCTPCEPVPNFEPVP
jgi:hypothetical protein